MILGDCLDVMPTLSQVSANMCFADFPFSTKYRRTTNQQWDKHVDLGKFLKCIQECVTDKSTSCFSANDAFAADLIGIFGRRYRYSVIWKKSRGTLYYHAKQRPLLKHEIVVMCGKPRGCYNPQMEEGSAYVTSGAGVNQNMRCEGVRHATFNKGARFPGTVQTFASDKGKNVHPTQKPVALLDWLIRTYSNPGDNVLDPVAGSFTTCVSACQNGRSSVGIERDVGYFEAGVERVRKACVDQKLDVDIEVRR